MSTDRELLELAAKAAGILLDYSIRPDGKAFYHSDRNALAIADGGWFAPLTDDGDALRLAVKLRLHVDHHKSGVDAWVMSWASKNCEASRFAENTGDDLADTRRAIVRAAAEIGRAMP